MGAQSYQELPGGEWSEDEKGVRSTTRNFLVVCTPGSYEFAATQGPGAPPIVRGDFHPADTGIVAKNAKVTRTDDQALTTFHVAYVYDNKPWAKNSDPSQQPEQQGQDVTPTDRPALVSYSSVAVEKVAQRDKSNPTPKDCVNSVGEPFDSPPLTYQDRHLLINVVFYKAITIDPTAGILMYYGSINDANFTLPNYQSGYPAKTLRVNEYAWNAEYDSKSGLFFWKVTLVLEYNYHKWNPTYVLNIGTRELAYNTTTAALYYRDIIDPQTGAKITKPVKLNITPDGNGQILQLANSAPAQYLQFNLYDEVNFNAGPPDVPLII